MASPTPADLLLQQQQAANLYLSGTANYGTPGNVNPAPAQPLALPAFLTKPTPPVYPSNVSIVPNGVNPFLTGPAPAPAAPTATPAAQDNSEEGLWRRGEFSGPPRIGGGDALAEDAQRHPVFFKTPGGDAGPGATAAPTVVTLPATNTPLASPQAISALHAQNEAGLSAIDAQKAATGQEAAAEGGISAAGAAGSAGERDVLSETARSVGAAADAREARAAAMQDRIDAASKSLADQGVDPSRFWDSRSTAQKISLGIGAVLGGFLQGERGGTNAGIDAINDGIDRDIAAQKAKLALNRDRVQDMTSLYARAYQATGDHDDATRLAKGILLDAAAKEKDRLVAVAGTPLAAAKGAELQAQLDAERAKNAGADVKEDIALHKYTPAQTVSVGGAGGASPLADKDAGKLVTIGSQTRLAPTEDAAKELRGEIEGQQRVEGLANEIVSLRQDANSYNPFSVANTRLKSLEQQLILESRKPGVRFGEGEQDMLGKIQGSVTLPPHLGGAGVDENLKALVKSSRDNLAKYVGSQKLPVVETGYGRDATGRTIRTMRLTGQDSAPPAATQGAPAAPPSFQSFGGDDNQAGLYEGRR